MDPLPALAQITPESPPFLRVAPRQATTVITTIVASQTATTTVTSTASGPTLISPSPRGPASGHLFAILLITICGLLLFIFIGLGIYCIATHRRRVAAREAASTGQELQPSATGAVGNGTEIQSAPQREVPGVYGPAGGTATGNVNSEEQAAARELYGYFAPSVEPRVGDGVVVKPGA